MPVVINSLTLALFNIFFWLNIVIKIKLHDFKDFCYLYIEFSNVYKSISQLIIFFHISSKILYKI